MPHVQGDGREKDTRSEFPGSWVTEGRCVGRFPALDIAGPGCRETRHPAKASSPPPFPHVAVSRFLSHTARLESPLSAANETAAGMTATTLGYARISTTGQDLDSQRDALADAGIAAERIFTDILSGAAGTDRPGLAALLDYVPEGVTVIDRLGRSVAEVSSTIAEVGQRAILLRALRKGLDTATPTGRAVAAVMATQAELELELGRDRRAAARVSRRSRQLPATKPPKLNSERQDELRRLAATGEPVRGVNRKDGPHRISTPGPDQDGPSQVELSTPTPRPGGVAAPRTATPVPGSGRMGGLGGSSCRRTVTAVRRPQPHDGRRGGDRRHVDHPRGDHLPGPCGRW